MVFLLEEPEISKEKFPVSLEKAKLDLKRIFGRAVSSDNTIISEKVAVDIYSIPQDYLIMSLWKLAVPGSPFGIHLQPFYNHMTLTCKMLKGDLDTYTRYKQRFSDLFGGKAVTLYLHQVVAFVFFGRSKVNGNTVSHRCHLKGCFWIDHLVLESLSLNRIRNPCFHSGFCWCDQKPKCVIEGKVITMQDYLSIWGKSDPNPGKMTLDQRLQAIKCAQAEHADFISPAAKQRRIQETLAIPKSKRTTLQKLQLNRDLN